MNQRSNMFPRSSWGIILKLLAIFWSLNPHSLCAQAEFSGLPRPGAPVFDLDYATFRQGADSVRLELYYRITNPHLSYLRRTAENDANAGESADPPSDHDPSGAEYFVAAYEIIALVSGDGERQVASESKRENYRVDTFDETRSSEGYLVNVLKLTVPPGDYDLEVTLNDRVSGNSHKENRNVDVRHFRQKDWPFGGPEFIDPTLNAPDHPVFRKGDHVFVPNVKRSFAGFADRVAFYLEFYRRHLPNAVRLVVASEQRPGRGDFVDTLTLDQSVDVVPLVYRSPLTGLRTGETRLTVAALDSKGVPIGEPLESSFWIDWTVDAMVKESWEEAVDMLVHIASAEEMNRLRETPENRRKEAFKEFWKSKDPSPDTPENEWREEYYRRIRFVNLHFSNAFRRGWRTDFGMVYIRYGEPDEIERHPFDSGNKPYEIWSYYGQNRQFLFVDVRGNGEYELQYPYDGYHR